MDNDEQIPAVFEGDRVLGGAALGVAIMMNGGPGTVHAPRAVQAFREPAK